MRTIERDIVAVFLFSSDEKLLVGQKDPTKGGVYPDCWLLPGGGVEAGETREQALRRELLEETEFDIAGYEAKLVSDGKTTGESQKRLAGGERVVAHMTFYDYEVRVDRPADQIAVTPASDLIKLAWIGRSDAPSKQFPPPLVDALTARGWL